jgi:hypothetical protein
MAEYDEWRQASVEAYREAGRKLAEARAEFIQEQMNADVPKRLTRSDKQSMLYFMQEKSIDCLSDWPAIKGTAMVEFPLMRLYLDRVYELEALEKAVMAEIEESINWSDDDE